MEDRPFKRRKTASPVRNVYPSYQSPTKASLARFNPALLPPPSRIRASLSSPLKPATPRRLSAAREDPLLFVLGDKARTPARHTEEPAAGSTVDQDKQEVAPRSDEIAASEPQVTPHGRVRVARPLRAPSSESDDLPETPQKLLDDPKFQDTPPRGILYNSTPRQQDQTEPSLPDVTQESMRQEAIDVGGDTEPDTHLYNEAPKRDPVPDPKQSLELEKKRAELYLLEKDLEALDADIVDLELHIGLVSSSKESSKYPDVNGLISIINRSDPLNQPSKQPPEQSTSALLASFLPFSIPITEPESSSDANEPTASYTPINTPALLSLHTPLTITTTTHAPLASAPTTQPHTIRLSSPHSLLNATLDLTTTGGAHPSTAKSSNPVTATDGPTITRLHLAHLSPWARQELGPWLAARAAAADLPAAGYACGRYWVVALRRAACWERVLRRWGHLAPGMRPSTATTTTTTTTTGRAQQPTWAGKELGDDGGGAGGHGVAGGNGGMDALECAAHLGRRSLALRDGVVVLRFEWSVGLDWAGDATSSVRASATFPSIWQDADERQALRQAPQAFDLLVKKYGVFNAINTMARLVFSADEE